MSVIISGIKYDLDQGGWGSALEYDDLTLDGLWKPDKVVVHWGGSTVPPTTTWGINRLFQGWQRFHRGKGWQDIAYGAGVGNDGLTRRLRGWNHQGATRGLNHEAWACAWAGGSGGAISPKAYAAMAGIVQNALDVIAAPVEVVIVHRDVSATTCPGDEWEDWVLAEGWITAPPPPPPTLEDEMFLPLHYGDGMKDGQELTYPAGHPRAGRKFTTDRENRRSDVRFWQGALRRAGASVNTDGFYTVETAAAVVKVTPVTAADTNGFDIHGNDADPIMAAAYGGEPDGVGLDYGNVVRLERP